jgi:hypothetical protein
MKLEDVRDNILDHHDRWPNEWAMSVNCIPGLTPKQISLRAARPNPKIRVARVRRIRDLQYEVRLDNRPDGHANVMFPHEPTDEELTALIKTFSKPRRNWGQPNQGRKR